MDRARLVAALRLTLLVQELRKASADDPTRSRNAVASHQAAYERVNGPKPSPERSAALQGLLDLVQRHGKRTAEPPAGVVARPIARPQALWHNPEFRPNRCLACIAGGRDECPHYPPPLAKMAIADNRAGEDLGEEPTQGPKAEKRRRIERQYCAVPRVFNYTHLLTDQHRTQGYRLHVIQTGDSLHAKVLYNDPSLGPACAQKKPSYAGGVSGAVFAGQLGIHRADMDVDHRQKGLGPAALEALMTHAYHHHNVRTVTGGDHSTSAHRMHQKLAQKHKLGYRGKENFAAPGSGFYDDKYGAYRYKIK